MIAMHCKKCNSDKIVTTSISTNTQASAHNTLDAKFGKISINLHLVWCSECGTPHSSTILDIDTPAYQNAPKEEYYWIHYNKESTVYKNSDCYTENCITEHQEVIKVKPLIWLYDFNDKGKIMHERTNPNNPSHYPPERYKQTASLINWKEISELEYILFNVAEMPVFHK